MKKLLFWLFATLIFFVPLILWPYTSEVFEFNKMVLVYILTVLVAGSWIIRMIIERKIIFRRTLLDFPLLAFLVSQLISTLVSIDPYTSWFGYYSRFNGGMFSVISYSLLFWAFVSNIEKNDVVKLLKYSLLPSAVLVSIYGVLEHFGIDKSIWVQDVQSRIFSTLGQPNWLAAWIVALIPITQSFALGEKTKNTKFWIYAGISVLFFATLLFTKSRSGLFGTVVAELVFWGLTLWKSKSEILRPFLILNSIFLILAILIGTQFTPSIGQLFTKGPSTKEQATSGNTALETGGTESGTIRKIVWSGALQIWLHYPIFGTGVETFAYSYYQFRPAAHNLTSEWDFIYNKAHNEFLNVAASTGTVGLGSYLVLIGFSIYILVKKPGILNYSLLAGYLGLSATNFFGFSVVPTQLEFFLFPAFAIVLMNEELRIKNEKKGTLTNNQKVGIAAILILLSYLLFLISRYWYADTRYNFGKAYSSQGKYSDAVNYFNEAISFVPDQAIYRSDLANAYANQALISFKQKDATATKASIDSAISESDKAVALSPANLNIKRSRFAVFVILSTINPNYLLNARDTLEEAVKLAPTDAKLFYNLSLTYARTRQTDKAITALQKTIELKPDYRDARLAYALLLISLKRTAEARVQLEYILTNIAPNDSLTKQTLEGIR